MNVVHLIAVGGEDAKLHVAGIPKFKADQVVVFTSEGVREVEPITEVIGKMGISCKSVAVGRDYLDSYQKASFEAATAFTRGGCIGINMSVGPVIVRTAMEDAIRIQLYHFLHHTSTDEVSAFKYFVLKDDAISVAAVPIWDFATYLHNDIFEILAATDKPIPLAQVYKILAKNMGREAPKWEAFRKTFREFKRSYRGSPCLVEVIGKGPRYKIKL